MVAAFGVDGEVAKEFAGGGVDDADVVAVDEENELAAGAHATTDLDERARRQDRLQRTDATFEPFPLDADAARAYGLVYAAVVATGGKARGARAVDLLIAATANAAQLPLDTRNPKDFKALENLVEIVAV